VLPIQQYMGDTPNKDRIADDELVNLFIIEPSMRSVSLNLNRSRI